MWSKKTEEHTTADHRVLSTCSSVMVLVVANGWLFFNEIDISVIVLVNRNYIVPTPTVKLVTASVHVLFLFLYSILFLSLSVVLLHVCT